MFARSTRVLVMLAVLPSVSACASRKDHGDAKSPAGGGAAASDGARQAPASEAPPPPPPLPQQTPAATAAPEAGVGKTSSQGNASRPPARSVASSDATRDIEAAQRELDVAGGDCQNACRALGSMDRAAGRLCTLASSTDERGRCTDARTRVYSARDKVKGTCGSCPDTSVDRNAPIPSR